MMQKKMGVTRSPWQDKKSDILSKLNYSFSIGAIQQYLLSNEQVRFITQLSQVEWFKNNDEC